MKPRLLDLFCGAGGCAVGYHRAGFEVVGVDIVEQPDYPFHFVQDDALRYLEAILLTAPAHYDVIHASPPCQAYIRSGVVAKDGRHPDLLGPTRELLLTTGLPYVIENVPGAPMRADILLCGSMFGLEVRRHRWFETNLPLPPWTPACDHSRPVAGVYGHPHGADGAAPGMLPGDLETWRRAMGIDWMDAKGLAAAIPPAYCEHIGALLLSALEEAA